MGKPILCRLGLHRWRFGGPLLTGSGARETCARCGAVRDLMFGGAYVYYGPLPAEAKAHLDRSFGKMDEAFGELDKAFNVLRDRDAAPRKAAGFEAEGQQPGPERHRPSTPSPDPTP